jgi:hypothetical protein
MNWFEAPKDLIAVSIAALAVVLSLITVVLQRRQQQRAAYREIYSTLMSDELHRGRWMINRISRPEHIPKDKLDYRLVYRTLGVFDNLAMYERQRVIPRKWVLDVWHHPLHDMYTGASVIRCDAEKDGAVSPWPQLWTLFDQAAAYRSSLACCRPDVGGRRSRGRRLAAPGSWRASKQPTGR